MGTEYRGRIFGTVKTWKLVYHEKKSERKKENMAVYLVFFLPRLSTGR